MEVALLRELKYLGVDEASLPVLALLPLAQVAWADGVVQEEERAKILELAHKLKLNDHAELLLSGWLTHAPSQTYIERGRRAMLVLTKADVGLTLDDALLGDVIEFSKAVAQAAGGFFGFRTVGAEELEVLEEIADALDVQHVAVPKEWLESDEDVDDEATDIRSSEEMAKIREAAHIAGPDQPARTLEGEAVADLIHHGADGGVNFPLDAMGLGIGRSRSNEVQIPHDHGLSRLHCRIVVEHGVCFLVDNDTTNGTFVNGERITKRRLFGGEQIQVGENHFTFLMR